MPRADDAEVASIEGRDLGAAKAFGGGYDGGVDGAEREVAVAGDEFGDPQRVGGVEGLDDEVGGEIAEEARLGLPAEACAEQITNLGDDEGGDDQRAGVGFQQLQAGRVVSIVCVYIGVERSGVDDQRDAVISALMISSTRSEVSLRPLRPAAAAPRRRLRPALRCATSAARVISAIVTPRRWASCRSRISRSSGSLTVVRRMGMPAYHPHRERLIPSSTPLHAHRRR